MDASTPSILNKQGYKLLLQTVLILSYIPGANLALSENICSFKEVWQEAVTKIILHIKQATGLWQASLFN